MVWLVIGNEVKRKEGGEKRVKSKEKRRRRLGCELIEEIFESIIGIRLWGNQMEIGKQTIHFMNEKERRRQKT